MLLIVLKKIFYIDDEFCLWENNGKFTKKNQCQASKQRKIFFKIHQQTNSYIHKIFGKNYAAIREIKPVLLQLY